MYIYRYHVYGLIVNTMHAMFLGAKSVILPKSVELSLKKTSNLSLISKLLTF